VSISVTCSNGHRLSARDDLAGKKVRCPKCQSILKLPATSPSTDRPSRTTQETVTLETNKISIRCSNGHKLLAPAKLAGKQARCPKCKKIVDVPIVHSIVPQTEASTQAFLPEKNPLMNDLSGFEEPEPSPLQRTNTKWTTRRWKVLAATAVVLLVLVAGGLSIFLLRGTQEPTIVRPERSASITDKEAIHEVVTQMAEADDEATANALLTDRARAEVTKPKPTGNGISIDFAKSNPFKSMPGGTFEVDAIAVTGDTAQAKLIAKEAGEVQGVLSVLLRREASNWRIYGFTTQWDPTDPETALTIDLENLAASSFFGMEMGELEQSFNPEQMEESFTQSFEDSLKPKVDQTDLDHEALASLGREALEASWKQDLLAQDQPAGDVIRELVERMDYQFDPPDIYQAILARPIRVDLRGKSLRELLDEACKQVGLYPTYHSKLDLPANQPQQMASMPQERISVRLAQLPRPMPIAFAGPFQVEVDELNEFVPHASGEVRLTASFANLPSPIVRLFRESRAQFEVVSVVDPSGNDLYSGMLTTRPITGLFPMSSLETSANPRCSINVPLKNLIRGVTQIGELHAKLRVPIPIRVETLRISPLVAGAVKGAGGVEVKLMNVEKSQSFGSANLSIRLAVQGIGRGCLRVVAYDAEDRLLHAEPRTDQFSGRESMGTVDFALAPEATAIDVKLITLLQYADYDVAFKNLPLHSAGQMPEKLTPATFPGKLPVSLEFITLIDEFGAESKFRIENHSNKDVRSLELQLKYFDAEGKVLDTSATRYAPCDDGNTSENSLSLAVRKNESATIDINAPFLPDDTKTIEATPTKVTFADTTEWPLVSGRRDNRLTVWDAQTGRELLTLKGHSGSVHSVAFSADGTRIVTGGLDHTIGVWDAATGREMVTLVHAGGVKSVSFSPDGRRIVSGSDDKTLRVWDAVTGQETLTLVHTIDKQSPSFSPRVTCVGFSPNGKLIASGSVDQFRGEGTIKVWDATTGQETLKVIHAGDVNGIAFSPDGKRLVVGSVFRGGRERGAGTLKVWDATTGQEVFPLIGHTSDVNCVAFSRDGARIVSGSSDKTVKIWDAQTGQELRTLNGHADRVTSVAFSPDGQRIVSGSDDKTLIVWDTNTGKKGTLKGHTDRVYSVAFSPDGKRIVSGSNAEILGRDEQ
jgi:WD40 repeat protein/phage FluMu protein Com